MDELVIMQNKQAVTTSLKVAEVFGKRHDNVMKSIKSLIAENSTPNFLGVGNMFVESTYLNKQKVHNNLKWTQKGRKLIYDLLQKEGVSPVILSIED